MVMSRFIAGSWLDATSELIVCGTKYLEKDFLQVFVPGCIYSEVQVILDPNLTLFRIQ